MLQPMCPTNQVIQQTFEHCTNTSQVFSIFQGLSRISETFAQQLWASFLYQDDTNPRRRLDCVLPSTQAKIRISTRFRNISPLPLRFVSFLNVHFPPTPTKMCLSIQQYIFQLKLLNYGILCLTNNNFPCMSNSWKFNNKK